MSRRVLGLISMLCFTGSYLPQLVRTFRTRRVDGVSTSYWVIVVLGYVSGWFYILPLRDPLLFVTYGAGLGCALAMLAGCLAFRGSGRRRR